MNLFTPIRFFIFAGILCLSACAPQPQTAEPADAATYFPVGIGSTTVYLQLALTQPESTRGLMHRDVLPEDHGMLFLYKTPGRRSFWMRNTRIPLDLGFFDSDGRLLEIRALYPYDETSVSSQSSRVQYAVEMNQGWFARNGVRSGAQLDLEALADAVRARGAEPETFALNSSGR